MKIFSSKNLVIFLAIFFVSCASKEDPKQIRIVDIQGKAHQVTTKIPPLNVKALAEQGRMQEGRNTFENVEVVPNATPAIKAQSNDYAAATSESLQETLQLPQKKLQLQAGEQKAEDRPEDKVVEYSLSEPEEQIEFIAKAPNSDDKKSIAAVDEKPAVKKFSVKKLSIKKSEAAAPSAAAVPSKGKKFYVQVGSFLNEESANQTLQKMKKFHGGKVAMVEGERTIYRSLLGPFANRKQANAMVAKIVKSGHEAILVRSN
jgi:cell division protein FtsN